MNVTDTNISSTIQRTDTTTKFVFPTSEPAESDEFYDLGFVIGMSLMGGFFLMILIFVIVTSCQRAIKAKKKKHVPLLPVSNEPNVNEPNVNEVKVI